MHVRVGNRGVSFKLLVRYLIMVEINYKSSKKKEWAVECQMKIQP